MATIMFVFLFDSLLLRRGEVMMIDWGGGDAW